MCHTSHDHGMCGIQCLRYRLLTFNLSLDFNVAMVPVSSKLTSLSSNLEHCKLLWKLATNLS